MNKEDQNKNPTSNINFPTGIKWEWDDYRKCLTYKTNITITDKTEKKKMTKDGKIDLRSGAPRIVVQNRQKSSSSNTSSKSEVRKQINSHIKIEDIKNAAIHMLSERFYIPANFESYCNDPNSKGILEEFLLYLINYFYWYFELLDSRVYDSTMIIERSEAEIKRTQTAESMLKKTIRAMAKAYCWIILGLDAIEYHHMNCGKNRVSAGYKDRGLFETFYPFCVFFIWITFKRRDYDVIRLEAGRILRSEAFNSSLKVESILEEDNTPENGKERLKSKEEILKKYEENRLNLNDFLSKIQNKTSTATLTKRSPVMVSILPSPQESSDWLFKRRDRTRLRRNSGEDENIELFHDLGILGQPMKLFHIKTLTIRGSNEIDDATDETKSEASHDHHTNGDSN